MDAAKRGTSKVPSLPPPRPKSPPEYPDLYGKRRELAKVQMLEREIGFLEEELKSVERIQPASRSCKEVTDFVVAKSDPLVTTNRKIRRARRFWKWLRYTRVFLLYFHVENCVSTSHGFAVVGAVRILKCHTAAAAAIYVIARHVPVVQYQSADVAPGHALPNVVTYFHAAEVVAFVNALRAVTYFRAAEVVAFVNALRAVTYFRAAAVVAFVNALRARIALAANAHAAHVAVLNVRRYHDVHVHVHVHVRDV